MKIELEATDVKQEGNLLRVMLKTGYGDPEILVAVDMAKVDSDPALTASQARVEELSAEVVQAWDAYHRQLEISRETVAVRDERTVKWLGEVESRNKAEAEAKKWQSAALEAGKWREVERTAKESAEAALRDLEAVYRKTKAEAKGLREQIIESRTEYAQAEAALAKAREEASCYKTAYEAEKAAFADLDAIYRKTESRLAAQAGELEECQRVKDKAFLVARDADSAQKAAFVLLEKAKNRIEELEAR